VPARVGVYAHAVRAFTRELLCAETPCTVSLPHGEYELLFEGLRDRDRHGSALVRVEGTKTMVNHALGQNRTHPVRPFGVAGMVAGGILLATAAVLAMNASNRDVQVYPEAKPMALIGLGSVLIGGIVVGITPATVQEGATTQWSPSPRLAFGTVSAGVTF
jgi:hypothetical protein